MYKNQEQPVTTRGMLSNVSVGNMKPTTMSSALEGNSEK